MSDIMCQVLVGLGLERLDRARGLSSSVLFRQGFVSGGYADSSESVVFAIPGSSQMPGFAQGSSKVTDRFRCMTHALSLQAWIDWALEYHTLILFFLKEPL